MGGVELLHGRLVLVAGDHAVLEGLHALVVHVALCVTGEVKDDDGLVVVGVRDIAGLAAVAVEGVVLVDEVAGEVRLALAAVLVVDPEDLAGGGGLLKHVEDGLLPRAGVNLQQLRPLALAGVSDDLVNETGVAGEDEGVLVDEVTLAVALAEELDGFGEVVALALAGVSELTTLPRAGLPSVGLHAVVTGLVGAATALLDVGVGPASVGEHLDDVGEGLLHAQLDVSLHVDVATVGALLELPRGVTLVGVLREGVRDVGGDAVDGEEERGTLLGGHGDV